MYSVLIGNCMFWIVGDGSDVGTDYGCDNVDYALFCGIRGSYMHIAKLNGRFCGA